MNVLELLSKAKLFSVGRDIEILSIKKCKTSWRILAINPKNGDKFRIILERC